MPQVVRPVGSFSSFSVNAESTDTTMKSIARDVALVEALHDDHDRGAFVVETSVAGGVAQKSAFVACGM
jgi:hypothetical protein